MGGQLITKLQASIDQARPVIAGAGLDKYDLPTPCNEWNVKQLVNHMIGALVMFRDVGTEGTADPALFGRDLIGPDAAASGRRKGGSPPLLRPTFRL